MSRGDLSFEREVELREPAAPAPEAKQCWEQLIRHRGIERTLATSRLHLPGEVIATALRVAMFPAMNRRTFLTLSSAVAFGVALFALGFPRGLLAGKGVQPDAAVIVWVREVGALILAAGITTFLVRKAPDSEALRGVLIGNAVLHCALLPIELVAYSGGVIPELAGVVPNSVLHSMLAVGFAWHAIRCKSDTEAEACRVASRGHAIHLATKVSGRRLRGWGPADPPEKSIEMPSPAVSTQRPFGRGEANLNSRAEEETGLKET